jgi:hypothetical protein
MTHQILIGTHSGRRQARERAFAVVVAVALFGFSAWVVTTLPGQVAFSLVFATAVVFITWLRTTTSAYPVNSPMVVATSTLRDRANASHRPSYDAGQGDRLFLTTLARRS